MFYKNYENCFVNCTKCFVKCTNTKSFLPSSQVSCPIYLPIHGLFPPYFCFCTWSDEKMVDQNIRITGHDVVITGHMLHVCGGRRGEGGRWVNKLSFNNKHVAWFLMRQKRRCNEMKARFVWPHFLLRREHRQMQTTLCLLSRLIFSRRKSYQIIDNLDFRNKLVVFGKYGKFFLVGLSQSSPTPPAPLTAKNC